MNILNLLNPWWKEGKVGTELAPAYRREIFSALINLIDKRQITIVSGLRRVGKSTLLYQAINKLLETKIKAENIVYFSFDEKMESIINFMEEYSNITGIDWKKEKCYIFLDEIQKLPDWSNKIKLIYDAFPKLKIIVSGSSSFYLEKEAIANLAGRYFIMNVNPLSFAEFLEMKGSKIKIEKPNLWEKEIKTELKNYLMRPFPELVAIEDLGLVKSYIKSNIIDKVIRLDLSDKFKRLNEDLLMKLIDIFYNRPGTYINYDDIAKDLKVSKKTLIDHIFYLEFAYLLRRIKNFRPSSKTTTRKLQRAYPFHWALGFGISGQVDYETIVASFLNAKFYWRKNEKEIDFLSVNNTIMPIEVKESESVGKGDLRHLTYFMKKFKIKESTLIYNGKEDIMHIDSAKINLMPLWKWLLQYSQ